MVKIFEGDLKAKDYKFAIILSRFNSFITERLLEGAMDALIRHGAEQDNITIFKTPGAFEIPVIAKKIAKLKKFDAIICIGAVIRGGTPHFEYIASEVTKGIAQVALESETPVTFGILTTDNIEQAIERAGTKGGNKGFEAAMASIELVDLFKKVDKDFNK